MQIIFEHGKLNCETQWQLTWMQDTIRLPSKLAAAPR
jgi:hypothetical protein